MRSKDHYGNDQLSGQQVQDCLRQLGLRLDRALLGRWMKSADLIGRGIFSIPVLLDSITRAASLHTDTGDNKAAGPRAGTLPNRKPRSERRSSSGGGDQGAADQTWRHILDLNSSMPRQKTKSSSDEREVRLKNVMRLKSALYSSLAQHQGYVPPKDVVQLALAYTTVFHLKLELEDLRQAVERSLGSGGNNSKVNIESFIKYVLDVVL